MSKIISFHNYKIQNKAETQRCNIYLLNSKGVFHEYSYTKDREKDDTKYDRRYERC